MRRNTYSQTMLKIDKFIEASQEDDLAEVLEGMGLNADVLSGLSQKQAEVRAMKNQIESLLARQKGMTALKHRLKRELQGEMIRLASLIRSRYPNASWLSALGLETRYATVADESGSSKRAVSRRKNEATLRSDVSQLLENFAELDASVRQDLALRGWSEERIAGLKTKLETFAATCDERDSILRQKRAQNHVLGDMTKELERMYRDFSGQARMEAGDGPTGQKLKAAAKAL